MSLSMVYYSNLFTKSVAVGTDKRQAIPTVPYTIPDEATRLLLAKLIFEEAKETINALGCTIQHQQAGEVDRFIIVVDKLTGEPNPINLEEVIDGACDTIYVATGVLAACGVPDEPHLSEVCRANNAKFPNGVATIDPASGKYLKPEGWKPPDHLKVQKQYAASFDPISIQNAIVIAQHKKVDS